MRRSIQFEALLDDSHQHIYGHGDPDLRLHGVHRGAVESLDAQMLLDPLEEQFDLPARLVQLADGHRWRAERVGQEDVRLLRLRILETDAPQVERIAFSAVKARQRHGLVADDPPRPVVRRRVHPAQVRVRLGAGDEERARPMQGEEPFVVEVGAVHHIHRRRLGEQQVEHVDIVQFAVGDVDEAGNVATQVEQRVHFHRGFGLAERRPGKQRQAEVDGGGIEGVDRVRQLQPQVLFGIQPSGLGDQPLRELGEDAPVPALVGVGQRGTPHGGADAHVVQLGGLCREHRLDVAQAFPVGQLGEGQHTEMIGAGKRANPVIAMVALDNTGKRGPGKIIHQLREKRFACVHDVVSGRVFPESRPKAVWRSSRHRQKSPKRVV